MRAISLLSLAALGFLTFGGVEAIAQAPAPVRMEPQTTLGTGTYINGCSAALNANAPAFVNTECGLYVNGLMRYVHSNGLYAARSADNVQVTVQSAQASLLLATSSINGTVSTLNITAGTVVRNYGTRVWRIAVTVAGSTVGGVYDTAATGTVAAANQIFVVPNVVGIYELNWPMVTGIVIIPGTGQNISVVYN